MSVEELMRTHDMRVRSGHSLNINCGNLRRIGKTTCIRTMLERTPQTKIIIIPNQNLMHEYRNLARVFVLPPISITGNARRRYEMELMSLLNGRGGDAYVFADEVPEAEELISTYCVTDRVHFVAGFYSVIDQTRHRNLLREPPPFTQIPLDVRTIAGTKPEQLIQQNVLDKTTKMRFIANEN